MLANKKIFTIETILEHNNTYRTFVFEEYFNAYPGQFAMVYLPGVDEKPFSLSSSRSITIEKVGEFTEKMFELKKGDSVYIREPLGGGFRRGNYLAIAGGSGISAIAHLVMDGDVSTLLYGAQTKEKLILNEFEDKVDVQFSTDDGTYGQKGFVTELISDSIVARHNCFAVCGPEPMIKHSAEQLVKLGAEPKDIECSLERYMKCGEGLCGVCECSGRRVCVDGPVFKYDELLEMPSFGRFKRDATGARVVA